MNMGEPITYKTLPTLLRVTTVHAGVCACARVCPSPAACRLPSASRALHASQ